MSILINNYPIFEDNQVLTSGQLNQLNKYLDEQTRLTRSCLIGMGIACGLDLDVSTEGITIKEGIGISSEGFLIKLCPESRSCTTVQYRPYTLPNDIVYTPFQDELFVQDIELHELLTANAETDEQDILVPLTEEFLKDKVVLLFLECLDKDLKSCLGKSCDELGMDRIFTLRKLLINVTDLDKVNKRSNGGRQDDLFIEKYNLKDISLPRVFFDNINTLHYLPLANSYRKAIDEIGPELGKLLNETYVVYEPILKDVYDENPFESSIIQDVYKMFEEYFDGGFKPVWRGMQYLYDFFKDLILAYKEFKDCAYDLMLQCCPDMTRFPRHLMLGKAIAEQRDKCEIDIYRHSFTQPPIYNHQNYLLAKTISLHKRIVLMLEKFSFEKLSNAEKLEMKVTPSCEKKSKLSLRSIPFYYDSKSKSTFEKLENLELEWSYERNYKQCQIEDKENNALNVSYDNNKIQESYITPLTTPLDFDIDQFNFLRIEGLLGKEISNAYSFTQKIKRLKNLSYDVRVVHIGDVLEEDYKIRPNCIYNDLQPIYEIWRNKFIYCLVGLSKLTDISRFAATNGDSLVTTNDAAETTQARRAAFSKDDLNTIKNFSAKVNRDNWSMVVEEVLHKTSSLNKRENINRVSENLNLVSVAVGRQTISGLFQELENCMIQLRENTPEDFQSFDFEKWLELYKCPLNIYVEILKLLSTRYQRGQVNVQLNTYFLLFCQLHGLIRNLAIFPYIDIRILYNTLKVKIDTYNESNEFSNFIKQNPGTVHKAGTPQGQTFILLYQTEFSDKYRESILPKIEAYLEKQEVSSEIIRQIDQIDKENLGKVLGDFQLPYLCCSPCDQIDTKPAQLDPFAPPIIETVPIRQVDTDPTNGIEFFEYNIVKEKLFHEVYEVDRYKVNLTAEAKYGDATIEYTPSDLNTNVNIQYLNYVVDINKVAAAANSSEDAYLIDEFTYEIIHQQTGEVIDSSVITILVPIIEIRTQGIKVGVTGRVITRSDGVLIGIAEATIAFDKFPDLKTSSIGNGDFSITTLSNVLPNGTHDITVFANGYFPKTIPVTINNNIPFVTVELVPIIIFTPIFTDFITVIEADVNAESTINLINDFRTTDLANKEKIKGLIEKEGDRRSSLIKVEETLSMFSKDSSLTVTKMNTVFSKTRDSLLAEIKLATGASKKMKTEGLKTMTTAYLDRLILTEPKGLSTVSKKTLSETAKLINSNEVNMKGEMKKWFATKDKLIGNKITNVIRNNFKI
ncbi:hypothetical protein D1818_23300 [Aquimarina sp. BL5]|uniref:hypothetical protein n=1 Tax=Aquimarina sp. BL5 TaxID=1714860 RepID=UPI000E48D587|nr:hypothetical protein [Aquimarina sp. BL5]AXT53606.1 hypothetical protein D1818_23300 [Aquimarina sp. BL5]RKN03877.1 hypothetical protein D7036_13080 [Aquimarina sp. BL5]